MVKYLLLVTLFFQPLISYGMEMTVSEKQITRAQAIPKQSSLALENTWSCGPNTLARFFVLCGLELGHQDCDAYKKLVAECPRSCGQPTSAKGYMTCAGLLASSVACLSYGWEGDSDVATGVVLFAASTSPFVIELINRYFGVGKVGPTPKWLVGYGNQILCKHAASKRLVATCYSQSEEMVRVIKNELEHQKPVIALVTYGPMRWHYITVVSFDESSATFKYLDTNSTIYSQDAKELVNDMDFEKDPRTKWIKSALYYLGGSLAVDIGRFNLICCEENE